MAISACPALAQYQDGDTRAWGDIDYKGNPWVYKVSRPNTISKGLMNRHISLWASHGRYFDSSRNTWKWQRPNLFCTTEDLFTQTIVVPFLIPMLENAGACVFTPRERDWQIHEVIVDNDDANTLSHYIENNDSKNWKKCDSTGFANPQQMLTDGENPFEKGTVRQVKATKKQKNSFVQYKPEIPEAGRYAVYVSYATLPKSVEDARYIVYHQGEATEFTVNQKMGGGTWVYLGSFDFDKGCSDANCVMVTNLSSMKGVVTTDAVRFGGGMGNIQRGGRLSGLPRSIEAARYYAQWAGMPYWVYGGRKGTNDYADDINCRSFMTNHLAGGSCFMPARDGLQVPIELSLAIHSDAGFEKNGKDLVGSLAVCTTDFNDGVLNSGIPRMTSKDLASALLNNFTTDMKKRYGQWNQRYLWDKNYSETRLPEVPSAILETLSHQSFPDMKLAQDPMARFWMARSIYKTLLRFITANHGLDYVVEPLAPKNFSVRLGQGGVAHLEWSDQPDKDEPSASATSYNVYIAKGKNGFDNGRQVQKNSFNVKLDPNQSYRFKVTACNAGGESFPSEVLAAYYQPASSKTVLVVNGFHRLASPQVVDNDSVQGFDMEQDPGVSYGLTAGWNGKQTDFDRTKMGIEGPGGLGFCGDEMAGKFIAGNTFDYTATHADAIAASGEYNIVSCSSEAVENGTISLSSYPCVDLILGLERHDGYTPENYKSFPAALQRELSNYAAHGGSLIVSGSYIGSDMQKGSERQFLRNTLSVNYVPYLPTDSDSIFRNDTIQGLGMAFTYHKALNSQHYAATHPEAFEPQGNAISAMQYSEGGCAAVARKENGHGTFVMGFPFECIAEPQLRRSIMTAILKYVMNP